MIGVDRVRAGLQADKFACLVVAADASPRALEKVVRLATARRVPLFRGPAADEIGQRLGKPGIMVAGVVDRALARGLAAASGSSFQTEG